MQDIQKTQPEYCQTCSKEWFWFIKVILMFMRTKKRNNLFNYSKYLSLFIKKVWINCSILVFNSVLSLTTTWFLMRHCPLSIILFMVITQPKHILWESQCSWGMTLIKSLEVWWVLSVFPSVLWSLSWHGDFFRRLASETITRQRMLVLLVLLVLPSQNQSREQKTQKPMKNSKLVYIWHVLMVFGVMIKCTGGQTTIHFLKSIRGGGNFFFFPSHQNHFWWCIWSRCMIHLPSQHIHSPRNLQLMSVHTSNKT